MNPAIIDTDILSYFFRNDEKVVQNVANYLEEYRKLNISIITYYEIVSGLMYKDASSAPNHKFI